MKTKGKFIFSGILVFAIIVALIITSTNWMNIVQGNIHCLIQQGT